MGTYNVPRNVKGEGRILFIFTTKSLIYSAVGVGVGLIFYLIFKLIEPNRCWNCYGCIMCINWVFNRNVKSTKHRYIKGN